MSTGILAACTLMSQETKGCTESWNKLIAKLQLADDANLGVDDWLFGMKAAGVFGRGVHKQIGAPEISGFSVRQEKLLLTESPSRFWIRMISVSGASPVASKTEIELTAANEPNPTSTDEFAQLPSVQMRRFKSQHNEMGLKNTLTFSSEWAYPFHTASIQEGEFHSSFGDDSSPIARAKFMKGNQEFCRVAQYEGLQLARVPLLDGYTVLFLLSEGTIRFREMDDVVFGGRLPSILSTALWKDVKLDCTLPILKLSQKLELKDGLTCLTDQGGPFASGLNAGSPLVRNKVSQSTLLQMDEHGVSAASSKTTNFSSISPGESLTIDRPFHVCVLADGSDFPILIARVISPEILAR